MVFKPRCWEFVPAVFSPLHSITLPCSVYTLLFTQSIILLKYIINTLGGEASRMRDRSDTEGRTICSNRGSPISVMVPGAGDERLTKGYNGVPSISLWNVMRHVEFSVSSLKRHSTCCLGMTQVEDDETLVDLCCWAASECLPLHLSEWTYYFHIELESALGTVGTHLLLLTSCETFGRKELISVWKKIFWHVGWKKNPERCDHSIVGFRGTAVVLIETGDWALHSHLLGAITSQQPMV